MFKWFKKVILNHVQKSVLLSYSVYGGKSNFYCSKLKNLLHSLFVEIHQSFFLDTLGLNMDDYQKSTNLKLITGLMAKQLNDSIFDPIKQS